MSSKSSRKKGYFPPEDLRLRVQVQLQRLGPGELAEALQLGRNTVLGVAAGARCHAGTLALVRERLPQLEGAQHDS